MKPIGGATRRRSMSIPDLALDLFHCPAQIAGDLRDRHAVAEELVEIG